MTRLETRKCVVTGAAKGIGRAIAQAFADEGAALALVDRDAERLDETIAQLRQAGHDAHGFVADVADETAVADVVARAEQALGRIDVLVNNAGIVSYARVTDMSLEMWEQMMAVNVRSAFLCSRAVLPGMRARGSGRIISFGSQLATKGAKDLAHYSASKAAIIGFTRALAREVIEDGINVNAICPGPIETELTRDNPAEWRAELVAQLPIGRYGEVHEIAPTAVMLACDDASFYVGATLNPNGGDVMI